MDIYGSQRALAKRLHRSQGWISERLSLLNLARELQARIGEEPIDLLRAVGNKPVEEQEAALAELKAARARKEETRAVPPKADPGDYGVITRPADRADSKGEGKAAKNPPSLLGSSPSSQSEDTQSMDRGGATTEAIPEPRSDAVRDGNKAGAGQQARPVPFDNPGELAMLLDRRLESDDSFFALLQLLNRKAMDRDSARLSDLARSFAEQAAARAT